MGKHVFRKKELSCNATWLGRDEYTCRFCITSVYKRMFTTVPNSGWHCVLSLTSQIRKYTLHMSTYALTCVCVCVLQCPSEVVSAVIVELCVLILWTCICLSVHIYCTTYGICSCRRFPCFFQSKAAVVADHYREGECGRWSSAGFVYGSGPSLTSGAASC